MNCWALETDVILLVLNRETLIFNLCRSSSLGLIATWKIQEHKGKSYGRSWITLGVLSSQNDSRLSLFPTWVIISAPHERVFKIWNRRLNPEQREPAGVCEGLSLCWLVSGLPAGWDACPAALIMRACSEATFYLDSWMYGYHKSSILTDLPLFECSCSHSCVEFLMCFSENLNISTRLNMCRKLGIVLPLMTDQNWEIWRFRVSWTNFHELMSVS